jgi:hypothetical protein
MGYLARIIILKYSPIGYSGINFGENKWLVPIDDSYSCITEPDVSDRAHMSAGYYDVGLRNSISASNRIRLFTFHSVIHFSGSFFVPILAKHFCL